jgi:hypothetical protein
VLAMTFNVTPLLFPPANSKGEKAEDEGFEPPWAGSPAVFKTAALPVRSSPPGKSKYKKIRLGNQGKFPQIASKESPPHESP